MCECIWRCSLFKEDDHWVANVQANVAAVVMSYWVASFFNDKAMPIPLVPPVEFLLDLPRDVREVRRVMIFKGLQAGDNGRLLLVLSHVSALDQDFTVSICSHWVESLLVIASHHWNWAAVPLRNPKCLNASRRYVYHYKLFILQTTKNYCSN